MISYEKNLQLLHVLSKNLSPYKDMVSSSEIEKAMCFFGLFFTAVDEVNGDIELDKVDEIMKVLFRYIALNYEFFNREVH